MHPTLFPDYPTFENCLDDVESPQHASQLTPSVSGRTSEPIGRMAERQKGFCHVHISWQNPLHAGQNFF